MSAKVDRAIHALRTNTILKHKYASLEPIAKAVGLQLAVAGAGALAFAGVSKGMEAMSHAKANMQKSKNLARILAVNPELRTVDPTKLSLAYNTLVRVSPKIAVDPLLAGQFMRNTLQVSSMSGMHVNTQDLATLAKIHDGKVHPFAEQFGAQLRGPMGALHAGQLLAMEGQEQRSINQDMRQQQLLPGQLAAHQFDATYNPLLEAKIKAEIANLNARSAGGAGGGSGGGSTP